MSAVEEDSCGSTLPPDTPKRKSKELDEAPSTSAKRKTAKTKRNIPRDAFVTVLAHSGLHQAKFRILPYSRSSDGKIPGENDHLEECIKSGGGLVIDVPEDEQSFDTGNDVIKILDLEYIRKNARLAVDMIIPYDCFSSYFIWNQIYQRGNRNTKIVGKNDADLNLFRVSPTSYASHDANGIFQGAITWDQIQPIASEKLAPACRVKDVLLQFFPELLLFPQRKGYQTRRIYTRHESQMILDKICEMNGHNRIGGITLYKEMEKCGFLTRSAVSLKEHFRKTILPHVVLNDGYYTISDKDRKKFQLTMDETGKLRRRSRKKECISEVESELDDDDEGEWLKK